MGYRIPDISEFKQGFKFEKLEHKKGDKSFGWTYFSTDSNTANITEWNYYEEDIWKKVEVFWDREARWITNKYRGIEFTSKEFPLMDWAPWITPGYIENLIKDGRIRTEE